MKGWAAKVILCLGLAITMSVPAAAAGRSYPLRSELRLSPMGIGPIHFGMNARQAGDALGKPVDVDAGINGCSFWDVPGLPQFGAHLTALDGRLGLILLSSPDVSTTRRIKVGDGVKRLRHRYRGELRRGRSASLGAADLRLFTDLHRNGATYTIEFDIIGGRIKFISAGTRHVIETFGECS